MVPNYQTGLFSSALNGNQIDLTLDSFHLQPPSVAIDVTVSHPLLPSWSPAASTDHKTLFLLREKQKDAHHRAGCINQGRSFVPLVFSSLGGISPRAREFIDSLFSAAYTDERAAGGSGARTVQRRQRLYDQIAAVIVRGGTSLSITLTTPDTSASSST